MIYTKEQLESMSEPCITIAICELRKIKHKECDGIVFGVGNVIGGNVVAVMAPIDFCNNPSDMMPLAFECNISLLDPESNGRSEWQADKFYTDFKPDIQAHHTNPLRACAIVYILVKQGEL